MNSGAAEKTGLRFASLEPRAQVRALAASKIREVANAGMSRSDVLAFWFGEPDEATPEFICRAAAEALARGETFYTPNLGLPELREAISGYVSGLHGNVKMQRIATTSSGVAGLQIAAQALVGPADRVVAVTPVWPNLTEAPRILGAEVVHVPLQCADGRWRLDLDRLLDALEPQTRTVIINSPNNPTGWVMTRAEQAVVLAACRRHGIWIVADEVYERLVYGPQPGAVAPSFLDIAVDGDRLICANSFSKSWLMTGWRLGWLVAPDDAAFVGHLAKLIEYNTSCAPGFVQRAGIVALRDGEPVVARTCKRYRVARDVLCAALARLPGTTVPVPDGAMYVFFRLEAARDSLDFCKRLVASVGVGLAPGIAFGAEGEGYLRWCLASSPERLDAAIERLKTFLEAR